MQNYNPNNNYKPYQNYNNGNFDSESKTVYHPPMKPQYSGQPQRPMPQQVQVQSRESNKNTQLLIILLSVCITIIVVVGAILIAFSGSDSNNGTVYVANEGKAAEDVSTTYNDNNFYVDPPTKKQNTTTTTTMPEPSTNPNVIVTPDEHDVVEPKPSYYQAGVQLPDPNNVFTYVYSGTIVTQQANSSVNMRTGPSKGYSSRKQLKTGTNVAVYGQGYDSNDQVWFYVYHGGKYGWVRGDYLAVHY